ncbi:hypothetical protein ABFS83_14G147400 [Erythranthe nasuta]
MLLLFPASIPFMKAHRRKYLRHSSPSLIFFLFLECFLPFHQIIRGDIVGTSSLLTIAHSSYDFVRLANFRPFLWSQVVRINFVFLQVSFKHKFSIVSFIQ